MRWLCIATAAVAMGCSEGRVEPNTMVRDSAGVQVATTDARAVLDAPSHASLGSMLFRIGSISDSTASDDILFRVAAARILGDGRMAILQGGHELRFHGPDGGLVAMVGGEGEGPGEFLFATDLSETADGSLAIWDASLGRLSHFSSDGRFERSHRLDLDGFAARFPSVLQIRPESRWRLIDDGTLLVFDYSFDEMREAGLGRPTVQYVAVELEGERADTLGAYGGIEQARLPGPARAVVSALDPDDTYVTVTESSGYVYVADGGLDHIDRFDSSGQLDLRIALVRLDRSPDQRRMEEAGDQVLETLQRRGVVVSEGAVRDLAGRDRAPAYRGLASDDRGHVWVRWGQQPDSSVALYAVFDPDGRFAGTVVLPPHERILDIARERIALLQRSSLDVETISVYALVSAAS